MTTVKFEPQAAFAGLEMVQTFSDQELETRAQRLLEQLTLPEKIAMMHGKTLFWVGLVDMLQGGYGSHTWDSHGLERLGIPGIRFCDGPRGVVMNGATTFPVAMARGATWDVGLERRIGAAMGLELRAMGGNLFGGVCINLLRHPAWGRAQETYGEDPHLLGEMGVAITLGVQEHVMACVKHFALNSMENARFQIDVRVNPRALHEIYLPHFKRVVDAGVASVMSAYNSVNGEWCGQNPDLFGILKDRWGFQGFVVTDWIFGLRDAKTAAKAGLDLEMPFHMMFQHDLPKLLKRNEVSHQRIDDAVLRLLRQQVRFGSRTTSTDYRPEMIASDAHRALSREAARKSIVLLKNDAEILPLKPGSSLAVIGRLANLANTGDGGSSNTRPTHVVTPLEGLVAQLDEQVKFADGSDLERAKAVAKDADTVLLIVGFTSADEGEFLSPDTTASLQKLFPRPTLKELPVMPKVLGALNERRKNQATVVGGFSPGGDRDRLELRPEDEALIFEVARVNPRVIVAIMAGSAVLMESWKDQVPGILMLWYPGMEGGHALADVVLGKHSPSGKLPFVIPTSSGHLPHFDRDATSIEYDLWHGHRKLERDGNEPAFPFGFGLSYTSFEYKNLQLETDSDRVKARLEITNTGARAGDEIVQLYVCFIGSSVERAMRELKAFARISLRPGETQTVTLEFPTSSLAYFDENQNDFVLERIGYGVFVGRHSLDPNGLRARFRI